MSGDLDILRSEELYSGEENPIILRKTYQSMFICSFDSIHLYPFDKEVCHMKFHISGAGRRLLKLNGKELQTLTSTSINQYEILDWKISEGNVTEEGNEGLIVTVQLGRDMINIIMVTYLPTLLINIINNFHFLISSTK